MTFQLQVFGAAEQVTGSLYVIRTDEHVVLLECGMIQGSRSNEEKNRDAFPVAVGDIDAVVLSHAHIDHSGRIPLLVKRGYAGPIYAQNATRDLCKIMLPDSGYVNERRAERDNKKQGKNSGPAEEAIYTKRDGEECLSQFHGIAYEESVEIVTGLRLRYFDAGHILGSAIVELQYDDGHEKRTLVFSGDLGYRDAPVMDPPKRLSRASTVLMESTYGDRLHRPFAETMSELTDVFETARAGKGNIIIPAFTVGRTQDLLYLMSQNYDAWQLDQWEIYLDSPMGIRATETYARYRHLYGARLFGPDLHLTSLPNFHTSSSTEESMAINDVRSGAIIIAGSGMCSGGRIQHHLKHNISRPECHIIIVGYQAHGTPGRLIVDGAEHIRLWGQDRPVRAQVHTVGGLSAHGDQQDLLDWYENFEDRPPVYLIHGEEKAQQALAKRLSDELKAPVQIAKAEQCIDI